MPDHANRRREERIVLDVPCFLVMREQQGPELVLMLANISPGGMMLKLGPERISFKAGAVTEVVEAPSHLARVLTGRKGRLAWSAEGFCGIAFDEPLGLDIETLREMTEAC